jgi:hypothetical protein
MKNENEDRDAARAVIEEAIGLANDAGVFCISSQTWPNHCDGESLALPEPTIEQHKASLNATHCAICGKEFYKCPTCHGWYCDCTKADECEAKQ